MRADSASPSLSSQPESGIYTLGTLRYDRRKIITLFSWLLWGDFAFTFFEQIFGRFMPLYLKEVHASNTFIGIATGSIAGLVNVFFLPNISQWSDRLRTRLGRRIPLLLVVSPLTALSLLGIGFAPEIGAWIHRYFLSASDFSPASSSATLLPLLCVCTVGFHFFNMVLVNAFNWLLRDVVPQVFMARFLAWFRVVGMLATVAFLWFVFPKMMDHRKMVFSCISLFYITVFMLMCWRVKEGEYPEPEPHAPGSSFVTRFGAYFRDCLSLPIYRNYFIVTILVVLASWCAGSFLTLYAKEILKLNYDEMGRVWVYNQLLSAVFFPVAGWLCDRVSAIKISLASLVIMAISNLASYYLISSKTSWLVFSLVGAVPGVAWSLGSLTLNMQLFPSKVFGQFSAGLNVFGCAAVILGNYFIGQIMDWTGSNYQYVYLWSAVFFALAAAPMWFVYRDWKKFGGLKNYTAPIPEHMLQE